MSDKDSSDEEDVFECGRCKEKFTDMTIFMCHKKEKACHKSRKGSGVHQEVSQPSKSEVLTVSPLKEHEVETTATLSPSISDIFSSKASRKSIDPSVVPICLFTALDHAGKQDQEMGPAECALCQEWYPNHETLDSHLQEKHGLCGLVSQASNLGQLDKETLLETVASPEVEIKSESPSDRETTVERTSRRARPDYSCAACNLKFFSRFKLEQHMTSRKHRNAVKEQKGSNDACKKRSDKRVKRGMCSMCGKSSLSMKDLKEHMRQEHGSYKGKENTSSGQKKPTTQPSKDLCRECGSLVPTKSLKRHEKRCENKKHFECPLCKHQSRERTDYRYHIDSHKVWIEIQKSNVPSESQKGNKYPSSAAEKTSSATGEADKSEEEQSRERSTGMTLCPADLAVLGLMPTNPQQSVEACLATLASGLKSDGELDQCGSEREPSENEDTSDNQSDEKCESSDTKTHPRQLKCKMCVKWFIRRDFSKHMYNKHSMKKNFRCRDLECLQTFTDLKIFENHITSHSDKLMFQCGCRQCIPNRRDVEADYTEGMRKWKMRQYYSQLSFKCNICWMKFPSERRLLKHQQTDSHRHACDKCDKVMVSKRQLRLHKEIHTDKRGYLCDMCGSGFKTDRDLRRHIASHSSARPFVCNSCGKGFLFKNKLTRHCNTVHAANKPHVCEKPGCKKSFARKDKLNDHMNTHKTIPPYVCKYCKKTFCRKDSVRDHEILSHTKEYPYKCKVCSKGFLRPKILENHETTEHGKNSNTASLMKLLKAQSEVQQQSRENLQSSARAGAASTPLSYVIHYDQSLGAVLQGHTESEALTLQTLQSMAFNSQPSSSEVSANELTYQMAEITGNAASGLAYQMAGIGLPDGQTAAHVTLTSALASTDSDAV